MVIIWQFMVMFSIWMTMSFAEESAMQMTTVEVMFTTLMGVF